MPKKPIEKMSDSLPEAFVERIRSELPTETSDRVLRGLCLTRHTIFRKNKLIAPNSDPVKTLAAEGISATAIPSIGGAGWVPHEMREQLLNSAEYKAKRIYVQNLASMLPPILLDVNSGHRVLDLTAAPGSKTLQLAEAAGRNAEIAAVELVRSRFFRLKANLEANGADFVRIFLKDGTKVWRYRPEHFDRVLLDAPCASEGRFSSRDPESYSYWTPRKAKEMARKQKALLYSAIQSVKPGGLIVYSTCSLSVQENEAVISSALTQFPDSLITRPIDLFFEEFAPPITSWKKKQLAPGVENARRVIPSHFMEGFFLCLLKKTTSTQHQRAKSFI